jgi:hypothetical protein
MDPAETVRRILQSAPGEGLCDACLAFGLELPLATIQTLSQTLAVTPAEYLRDVRECDSCGRVTATTVFVAPAVANVEATDRVRKCIRCSHRVTQGEEEVVNGDLFHRQCWAILQSQAQIADSRQMTRLTRLRVRDSQTRLRPDKPNGDKPHHSS